MEYVRRSLWIILQLPVPGYLDKDTIINSILPQKDVDGLTSINAGKLFVGKPEIIPATPRAVLAILDQIRYDLTGRKVVIIGRSNLVSKPLSQLLTGRDATVTLCHSKTRNLDDIASEADILISAAGCPGLITGRSVKNGAVVIDIGIKKQAGKILGDVDFDSVKDKVSYITPVPGGVGPVTVAMLLANTVEAAGL
jgi:methylenetetrahydrofolate dehydrogenase (NADP+)/methenyltetrahydrofolate cyclohydrolase